MGLYFLVIIAVGTAVIGYSQASQYARHTGKHAWGLSPLGWAALFGCSLLLGAILFTIATSGRNAPKGGIPRPVVRISWVLRWAGIILGLPFGALALSSGIAGFISGDPFVGSVLFTVTGGAAFFGGLALIRSRPPRTPRASTT